METRTETKIDRIGFCAIGLGIAFPAFTYGLKAIVSFIGLSFLESFVSLLVYLCWFVFLIVYLHKRHRFFKPLLLFEMIYGLILLLNYVSFPNLRPFYSDNFMFLRQIVVVYIPCGAIIGTIDRFKNGLEYINKPLFISGVVMLIAFFMGYTTRWDQQYFGIHLSPAILFSFAYALQSGKKSYLLFSFIGLFFLVFGGRQSLVICAIGIFVLYLLHAKLSHKILCALILLAAGLSLFLVSDGLLNFIQDNVNLGDSGSVRAIEMLLEGKLFDASNRTVIYESSIALIQKNGASVNGLFADRFLLRNYVLNGSWIAYAHNVFLEIWLDFGLAFGTLLILIYILLCLISYQKSIGEQRAFGVLLFLLTFIRLFVSSSFLIEGLFYVHLGFLVFSAFSPTSSLKFRDRLKYVH